LCPRLQLTPDESNRLVKRQQHDVKTPVAKLGEATRTQARRLVHFVSSPKVTNVMQIVWPASRARS
jgi:hypothetical protein